MRTAEFDLTSLGLGVVPLSTTELRRKAIGEILSALKHLPGGEREAKVAGIEAIVAQDATARSDDA